MKWSLEFWCNSNGSSPVLKELRKLHEGDTNSRKKFRDLVRLLEELGPDEFGMPSVKHIKSGLFELRDIGSGKRYYFCSLCEDDQKFKEHILLLVAVGDKSSQQRDIKKAQIRMIQNKEKNIYRSK